MLLQPITREPIILSVNKVAILEKTIIKTFQKCNWMQGVIFKKGNFVCSILESLQVIYG